MNNPAFIENELKYDSWLKLKTVCGVISMLIIFLGFGCGLLFVMSGCK